MISIIIATFNRAKSLPASIESILHQTYQDFEIIIVDDGSTDDTSELFKSRFADKRIRYIKLSENKGATFARNRGLEEVKGEYFLVWDSDDILYPNALETAFNTFSQYKNLAVFSAPARSLKNRREIDYPKLPSGVVPKETVICRDLPSNHKVRIAKTASCGNVRYHAKNIDFLVNVEMAERGDWYCHTEYLADVILESDKTSLTIHRKKTNFDLAVARTPFLVEYLNKYRDLLKSRCPERYAGFSYGAAIGFLVEGKNTEARKFSLEALKSNPNLRYFLFLILNCLPLGRKLFRFFASVKNTLV